MVGDDYPTFSLRIPRFQRWAACVLGPEYGRARGRFCASVSDEAVQGQGGDQERGRYLVSCAQLSQQTVSVGLTVAKSGRTV